MHFFMARDKKKLFFMARGKKVWPPLNKSIDSPTTVNARNGYFVMPDFNNSLTEFSGREASQEAQLWIDSVESVARIHGWPESFKMEIVRTKLVGPSRNWYIGRTFMSWSSFVDQYFYWTYI
jgi:hypothetical protein